MTLPYVALDIVLAYCEKSEPAQLLNLARVNRAFRHRLLDDRVWARYNVYGVTSIAQHYVTTLKAGPELLWIFEMDFKGWLDMRVGVRYDIETAVDEVWDLGTDRYSQLTLLKVHASDLLQGQLESIHPAVWSKWAAHFSPPQSKISDIAGVTSGEAPYFEHVERDVYLALARTGGTSQMEDRYLDDREIAMALIQSETAGETSLDWSLREHFTSDVEFMREVVDNDPDLYLLATGEARLDEHAALWAIGNGSNAYEIFAHVDPVLQEDGDVILMTLMCMGKEELRYPPLRILTLVYHVFGNNESRMIRFLEFAPRLLTVTAERLLLDLGFLCRVFRNNAYCEAYAEDMVNGYCGEYSEEVISHLSFALEHAPTRRALCSDHMSSSP